MTYVYLRYSPCVQLTSCSIPRLKNVVVYQCTMGSELPQACVVIHSFHSIIWPYLTNEAEAGERCEYICRGLDWSWSAMFDWWGTHTQPPPQHSRARSTPNGVRATSMQARRKASLTSYGIQTQSAQDTAWARHHWCSNPVLHMDTHEPVSCVVLCPRLGERWREWHARGDSGDRVEICPTRRVLIQPSADTWKTYIPWPIQPKHGPGDLAKQPSKLDIWWSIQPKHGPGDLAKRSSKFDIWWRLWPKHGPGDLSKQPSKLDIWLGI